MSSVTSTTTTKGVKKAFCLILASLNLVPYLLLLGTLIYILVRWEVSHIAHNVTTSTLIPCRLS